MPWYRQDIDLHQKQLGTFATATTFLTRNFTARFIMVQFFHPENFIEIMTFVHELQAYKICPDIVTMLI